MRVAVVAQVQAHHLHAGGEQAAAPATACSRTRRCLPSHAAGWPARRRCVRRRGMKGLQAHAIAAVEHQFAAGGEHGRGAPLAAARRGRMLGRMDCRWRLPHGHRGPKGVTGPGASGSPPGCWPRRRHSIRRRWECAAACRRFPDTATPVASPRAVPHIDAQRLACLLAQLRQRVGEGHRLGRVVAQRRVGGFGHQFALAVGRGRFGQRDSLPRHCRTGRNARRSAAPRPCPAGPARDHARDELAQLLDARARQRRFAERHAGQSPGAIGSGAAAMPGQRPLARGSAPAPAGARQLGDRGARCRPARCAAPPSAGCPATSSVPSTAAATLAASASSHGSGLCRGGSGRRQRASGGSGIARAAGCAHSADEPLRRAPPGGRTAGARSAATSSRSSSSTCGLAQAPAAPAVSTAAATATAASSTSGCAATVAGSGCATRCSCCSTVRTSAGATLLGSTPTAPSARACPRYSSPSCEVYMRMGMHRGARIVLDGLHGLEAVHARHQVIHEDHVGTIAA